METRPGVGAGAVPEILLLIIVMALLIPGMAWAHGSERGLVMLLPTGFYITGGALAVALSFLLIAMTPASRLLVLEQFAKPLFPGKKFDDESATIIPSLFAFIFLLFLVACGFLGATDPLLNPLPMFIWTLWWVSFTLLQCVTGNLWAMLNPWSGVLRLLGRSPADEPRYVLPSWTGYLPATGIFFGFAWFELIDLAPQDPLRLAKVVSSYWLGTLIACLLFGERQWMERGEPFAIFFRLIGALSPFSIQPVGNAARCLILGIPGGALARLLALPFSGVLFVLLTLSAVSFDGFSRTFTWLSLIDINPLMFPGRSAVVGANTIGLLGSFLILSTAYFSAVLAGCYLAGKPQIFREASGRLVYSIIPISLAFHFAHYLTLLLNHGQYAYHAFSDPFAKGWNLLGAKDSLVTTSFLSDLHSVTVIWAVQTFVIVLGHIIGIVMAHLIAAKLFEETRMTMKSQLVLALLMVFYTLFGLWLLSTPTIS